MSLIDQISAWMAERVTEAQAKGIVVGLSGGIDSAVVVALARRAVGSRVLGVIMPCYSEAIDSEYALLVARRFGIEVEQIDLSPAYDALMALLPPGGQLAMANLKPRLRMITNYYFANNRNYLVAGTGNKSEIYVGYYTKYGDGGADLLPIGGLLKTEVRALARDLDVPQEIINRTPTAGLWEGQTDEGEIGMTYCELDQIIAGLEIGQTEGLRTDAVAKVCRLHQVSQHKRALPPVFVPQGRPAGVI